MTRGFHGYRFAKDDAAVRLAQAALRADAARADLCALGRRGRRQRLQPARPRLPEPRERDGRDPHAAGAHRRRRPRGDGRGDACPRWRRRVALSLRRGTVTAVLERHDGLARIEVDGTPCVTYPRLTGPVALGDEVMVNTQARDLGLGSGGFDVLYVNLTRGLGLAAEPDAHVMKLPYTPGQVAARPRRGDERNSPIRSTACPSSAARCTARWRRCVPRSPAFGSFTCSSKVGRCRLRCRTPSESCGRAGSWRRSRRSAPVSAAIPNACRSGPR